MDRKDSELSAEDRRLIQTISAHYAPPPMTRVQHSAFRQRLQERLDARPRFVWVPALAAAVAALLVVWFALPQFSTTTEIAATDSSPPVIYAFIDPDQYTDSLRTANSLPDDYIALAKACDVPLDTP